VVGSPEGRVSYVSLLKNGNFFRFFVAQSVSSLGDWIGVIALAVIANTLFGAAGVGLVMTARVLPGFFIGPLAGVLADRWDRKKTMVIADIGRAAILFSLPFVRNLPYFLVASALLESLTLAWGPAKDASLPHFVRKSELTHANSLSLIGVYGPWPLASILFASLSGLGGFLATHVEVLSGLKGSPEALALWLDSITFAFSAAMVSTLSIPRMPRKVRKLDFSQVRRDLIEGFTFVRAHKQVRPWMLGIVCTFMAAGGVFSLGPGFAKDVLTSTPSGFAFITGGFGTGMMVGLLASGLLSRRIKQDILFSSSILLLGGGLIALAGMSGLNAAVSIASALGFFAGVGYSTGYSLMQETTEDELRGRTFSAAYTLIRVGILVGLGVFPLVAGAIGDHTLRLWGDGTLSLPGSRVTLWLAGLVVVGGGALSMTAIRARHQIAAPSDRPRSAYFVVFEGGEGAGKSTQMSALMKWLEARGSDVIQTREPGGTALGTRIRDILLDDSVKDMDPHAEALLYAADRAQHVAEVIAPALSEGKIVVSDRFVDSSLAYQGLARGLGLDKIYEISRWATGGLLPDVVFFMRVNPSTGLQRVQGPRDRLEKESADFHERVGAAYEELAKRWPDRFVVLDASRSPADIHECVRKALTERFDGIDELKDGQEWARTDPVLR
jgi:dTMP kinase